MKTPNVGLQFIAAILVIALATGVWWWLFAFSTGGSASIALGIGSVAALWAVPIVSVLALVFGFPAALLGVWRVTNGWAWAAAGALSGTAVLALLGGLISYRAWFGGALFGFVPGLVGGVYWWWAVARYMNENPWTDAS